MSEVVRGGRARRHARVLPLVAGISACCLVVSVAPSAVAAPSRTVALQAAVVAAAGPSAEPVTGSTKGATGRAGDPVIVTLRGSDPDSAPAQLTYSAAPESGNAKINGDQLTYTPADGVFGTQTFDYTATDEQGESATSTVTITVTHDPAPVAGNAAATTRGSTDRPGTPVTIPVSVSDNDSAPLVYAVSDPPHGSATIGAPSAPGGPATIIYTPGPGFSGPEVFTWSATDSHGEVGTGTVTVDVVANRAPVGTPLQQTVRPGSTNTFTLSATDPDNDAPLTYSQTTPPTLGTASLTPGGVLTYAANATAAGRDPIGITVTDARGAAGTFTVTVTVNTAPVASDVSMTVKGATTRTGDIARVDLAATDPDVPDRTLRYELLDQPAPSEGTVGLSGSQLTFTPKAGYSGTVGLRYRATDMAGEFATATVTIVVSPNEAPTTPNVAKQTQGSTGKPGDPVTIALPGSDVDGIASYAFSAPARGTAVRAPECAPSPNICGSVVYTPSAANAGGTDTFTYTATDGRGATSSGTVTITVISNDKPVGITNSGATIFGRPVKIYLEGTDRQGDPLTFTASSTAEDASLTYGVEFPNDPVRKRPYVMYVPKPIPTLGRFEAGTDSFSYKVQDSRGASSTKSITVDVAQNSPPVPMPVAETTRGGSGGVSGRTKEFELSATDPDAREGDGPLTFALVGQPENGTATLLPSGTSISYTPEPGFVGTETITYRVTDHVEVGDRERPDLEASTTATAKVTVTANQAPPAAPVVAVTGASTISAGLPVVVRLASVDPDGDAVSFGVGTVSAEIGVISGINGEQFTFTPVQSFSGPVLVPYTVTDALGATATGVVVIDVRENHAPVAKPASAVTRGGTTVPGYAVPIPLAGNISDPDTSLFRDRLTVTLAAPPAYGTVTVSGTTLRYTPRAGYVGTDVIGYRVSDGRGGSVTSTVTVTVTANRAPVLPAIARTIVGGSKPELTLTAVDPERDQIVLYTAGPARKGSAVLNGTRLKFTAPTDYAGPVTIRTTAKDALGAIGMSTVTFTVLGQSSVTQIKGPSQASSSVPPTFTAVVVTKAGSVSGGTVTVREGTRVVASGRVAWNGTVRIVARAPLSKGTHRLTFTFGGTASTGGSSALSELTVR